MGHWRCLAVVLLCLAWVLPASAQSFAPAPVPPEVYDEIAVDLNDDVEPSELGALSARFGLRWGTSQGRFGVVRASARAGRLQAAIAALRSDPRVQHAEPMSVLFASFAPNDPLYQPLQWHLRNVEAETAWDYGCGQGATVAVVDTGIACFEHGPFAKSSDLAGTRCVAGYDFVNRRGRASDDNGHGTHVAGTIAQTTNNAKGVAGVAHCARLMPVKVLSREGWGRVTAVANGIRFAADNGAQVINLSLGSPAQSRILEQAVRYALERGVVVVAAAGNSRRAVEYPAAYQGVIAVSAIAPDGKLAPFSSRGPQVWLAAPGVDVTQQTVCEAGRNKCELFATFSGTSMAAPHVAGSAALLVSMGVTDPASVRATLGSRAKHRAERNLYGAGVLDAGAAVRTTWWRRVAVRGLALLVLGAWLVRRIRRRGGRLALNAAAPVAAVFAGVGLLAFAPLLGLGAGSASGRLAVDLLMRPFGEWDTVLNAGWHRWLPLANALPVLGLVAAGFGVARLRPIIGGFALGMAALLTSMALFGGVATPGGPVLLFFWALANAAVCLWVARVALER